MKIFSFILIFSLSAQSMLAGIGSDCHQAITNQRMELSECHSQSLKHSCCHSNNSDKKSKNKKSGCEDSCHCLCCHHIVYTVHHFFGQIFQENLEWTPFLHQGLNGVDSYHNIWHPPQFIS